MTPEQIDQMPAGPEINELIAAELFGAIPLTDAEWEIAQAAYLMCNGPQSTVNLPRLIKIPMATMEFWPVNITFRLEWPRDYTQDGSFGSSRMVVDKMREDGWLFSLYEVPGSGVETLRIAAFEKLPHSNIRGCQGKAEAHTDALAIARAALKAKLTEVKHDR